MCLREHGGTKPRYCNGDLTCDSRVRLNSNGEEEFARLDVRKTVGVGLHLRLWPRIRDISVESQLMISLKLASNCVSLCTDLCSLDRKAVQKQSHSRLKKIDYKRLNV